MVLVWPRVFEWYLNGFFNDILNGILDSLYRSVVLNGILKLSLRIPLSPAEISLILNGIQW